MIIPPSKARIHAVLVNSSGKLGTTLSSIRYHVLAPMLLNEMQKQQRTNEEQQRAIEAQRRENQAQQAAIAALTTRLALLEIRDARRGPASRATSHSAEIAKEGL